ncbi:MAG: hypothetical protein R3E01_34455 [Pirellulaceae bacterium]|nr:hypothetical protein [Planctomycetales bacterium]
MPLRDHFRAPLDDVHSWDELHGMWPAMIVRQLVEVLPEPYFAAEYFRHPTLSILQPEDIGRLAVNIASLPPRAHVPELVIKPVWQECV